jgi:hypothetical protein
MLGKTASFSRDAKCQSAKLAKTNTTKTHKNAKTKRQKIMKTQIAELPKCSNQKPKKLQ